MMLESQTLAGTPEVSSRNIMTSGETLLSHLWCCNTDSFSPGLDSGHVGRDVGPFQAESKNWLPHSQTVLEHAARSET